MALEIRPMDSRLSIRLEIGMDGEGNPRYSTRTYSGIKADAADQDVYDIATMLTGLQSFPVFSITRVNQMELVEA